MRSVGGIDRVFGVSVLDRLARRRNSILGPGVRLGENFFCLRKRIVTTDFLLVRSEIVSAGLNALLVRLVRHDARIVSDCRAGSASHGHIASRSP